jgi:transcriptional regulator with XRE-family HTH domain
MPAGLRGGNYLRGQADRPALRQTCTMSLVLPTPPAALGVDLQHVRRKRHVSQLDLALQVGVSQRHLSYVETGKSRPSRSLLLALLQALEVPLAERNRLLLRAGYAPQFGARPLDDAALAPLRNALQHLLAAQEPAPAIVLDAGWNLLLANRGAQRLLQLLGQGAAAPERPLNLLQRLFDPAGLRRWIRNFDEVAATTWQRAQQDALLHPPLAALLHSLRDQVPAGAMRAAALRDTHGAEPPPMLTTQLDTPLGSLAFFSAFTTIGTPQDITVASLRVEHFFPADPQTRERLQKWADETGPAGIS